MAESTLDTLVSSYGVHDSEAKELKKVCDYEKEKIKSKMVEFGLKNHTAGGYVVSYSEQQRVSVDTEKMVQVIMDYWESHKIEEPCPYVKQVYVLDDDALETGLYKNLIPVTLIDKLNTCREIKTVQVLKCSKEK